MKAIYGALLRSALIGVVSMLGSGMAASEDAVTTIKLHQSPPELTTVDSGKTGRSAGDILAFEADLQGEHGLTAKLNGYNSIMEIAVGGKRREDRISHIVFDFGDGSTIIVAGRSSYNPDTLEISNSLPQPRAIIGGTGKYIGARGEVATVRNSDGSYEHSIALVR